MSKQKYILKFIFCLIGAIILVGLTAKIILVILTVKPTLATNIYPPTATKWFFGDANGDTAITGIDSTQWNMYITHRTYTTDTLQPDNDWQRWNTCDVNGDRLCNGMDVTQLNFYILRRTVTIGGQPWTLTTTVPLTGNPTGTWIPFQNNVAGTYLAARSGRPGIVVETTIISGSGELSGRNCNPILPPDPLATRDQLTAPGAQCALGVTITNWPVSTGDGLTETGTYGMQLKGNGGDIVLQMKVYAWPEMDITGITTLVTVSFPTVDIQACVPDPAEVGQTSSCPVVAAGGTPAIDGSVDTCGGAINGTGPWTYDFVPAGPGTCLAAVINGTATDQQGPITINPAHAVDIQACVPDPAVAGLAVSCPVVATGGTPAVDAGVDTCGGAINGTGPWTYDFVPAGPGTCLAAVINGTATDQQGPITINPAHRGIRFVYPSNILFLINNDDAVTSQREVTLSLQAKDAVQFVVSNFIDFADASWQPFTSPLSLTWLLTIGDGLKDVYVMFRSITGNNSPIINDSIELNTNVGSPVVLPTPVPPLPEETAPIPPPLGSGLNYGDIFKAIDSTVYYYGNDGKRYIFPNEGTYFSWYQDYKNLKLVSVEIAAQIPLGNNVTYKPGVKMLKLQNDPKVYAVDLQGTLRWVTSETAATALYGSLWQIYINDVPDVFFFDYKSGAPIASAADFNPALITLSAVDINTDKGL